jgi:hypothetical protein
VVKKAAKKTVTFRRITFEDFNNYFQLEGPGWRLALESDAAGELDTALNKLEAVVLLNKLYAINLQNQIMLELTPFGTDKVVRYFELEDDARAEYLVNFVGKDRAVAILKQIVVETREQACIGQNDKAAPKRRL